MDCSPPGFFCPWNFSGNPGVVCHFHLQGIVGTQGSKQHLLCFLCCQGDSWPLETASPLLLHCQGDSWPLHHLGLYIGDWIFNFMRFPSSFVLSSHSHAEVSTWIFYSLFSYQESCLMLFPFRFWNCCLLLHSKPEVYLSVFLDLRCNYWRESAQTFTSARCYIVSCPEVFIEIVRTFSSNTFPHSFTIVHRRVVMEIDCVEA